MVDSVLDPSNFPYLNLKPAHWKIVKEILQKNIPTLTVWAFGSRVIQNEISITKIKEYSDLDWATTSDAFKKIIEKED